MTNAVADTTTRHPTSSPLLALVGHSLRPMQRRDSIMATAGIPPCTAARHHPASTSEQGRQTTDCLPRLRPQTSLIRRSASTHRTYPQRCLPSPFAPVSRLLGSVSGPRLAGLRSHHPRLCLAILPANYDTSMAEGLPSTTVESPSNAPRLTFPNTFHLQFSHHSHHTSYSRNMLDRFCNQYIIACSVAIPIIIAPQFQHCAVVDHARIMHWTCGLHDLAVRNIRQAVAEAQHCDAQRFSMDMRCGGPTLSVQCFAYNICMAGRYVTWRSKQRIRWQRHRRR